MTKYIMAISFTICNVFINIHFLLRSRFNCVICESVGTDLFFFHPFCSSLLKGRASHKDVDNNTILRIYYESRVLMII